jgi:hypothetical protein
MSTYYGNWSETLNPICFINYYLVNVKRQGMYKYQDETDGNKIDDELKTGV